MTTPAAHHASDAPGRDDPSPPATRRASSASLDHKEHPAWSLLRFVAHGMVGWALCGAVMGGLLQIASMGVAITLHASAAPLIFAAVAAHYFRARGAYRPLPTALGFTAIVMLLDAGIVAGLVMASFEMFTSFAGTWLPFLLIFLAVWIMGAMMSTIRPKKPSSGLPGR